MIFLHLAKMAISSVLLIVFCASSVALEKNSILKLRQQRAENRAYEGAPPQIPHAVEDQTPESCLACHESGMVDENNKSAPVSPHPVTQKNCLQCHVPRLSDKKFKESQFKGLRIEGRLAKANPLGPPHIPHRIQDRENCQACHLSETAPKAIVPRHGNRSNCLQCHVPQ